MGIIVIVLLPLAALLRRRLGASPGPSPPPDDAAALEPAPPPVIVDRPSIAVLPFTNMSGDAEHDYLADGMTEDLITHLARVPGYFVIARNSTFAYRGTSPDIRQVGKDLGVRYVVEGSVRRLGDRLRVTAQLIEAETGMHCWAQNYDRSLDEIFAVQDEVMLGIASALGTELTRAEVQRARKADAASLDAWGLMHRGMAASHSTFNQATIDETIGYYRKALEKAPDEARAHALLAGALSQKFVNFASADWRTDMTEAMAQAQLAIDLEPDDPIVLGERGMLYTNIGKAAAGVGFLERSLELNPNSAHYLGVLAFALVGVGRAADAVESVHKAMRRAPRAPTVHWMLSALAKAHLQLGKYDDAEEAARESIQRYNLWPQAWCDLALALAALGRMDEAREAVARARRLDPDARFDRFDSLYRWVGANAERAELFSGLLRQCWEK